MTMGDSARTAPERDLVAGAVALGSGIALLGLNNWIAEAIAAVLPLRMRVKSAGSVFRSFEQLAPYSIAMVGLALLVVGAMLVLRPEVTDAWIDLSHRFNSARASNRWFLFSLITLLVLSFIFSLYMAYPHNAAPHDSRIHWTDFHLSRRYNYWYTLVRARIPFTNHPTTFQAFNIVVNVWLMWWFMAKFTRSRWIALGFASTIAFAPNLIRFSDTAEDVHLSLTALIVALIAGRSRRPWVLAVATVFAISARPPFLALVGAYSVAEVARYITGEGDTRLWARLAGAIRDSWKFILRYLLWFIVVFALYQLGIEVLGDRWVFTNGRLVDSALLDLDPLTINGFTISAFSGAYVTHMFWVLPLPIVLLAVASPWLYRRYTPDQAYFVALSTSFALAQMFILEYIPLLTFDARYLVYLWPFLIVAGWAALGVIRSRVGKTASGVLLAVFMLSPLLIPFDALADRNERLGITPTELVQNADTLRNVGARSTAFALYGGTTWEGNALVWVYGQGILRLDPTVETTLQQGWTVLAPLDHQARLDNEPSLRRTAQLERFLVYSVEATTVIQAPNS